MNRSTFRRRPDGVYVIVRPGRARQLAAELGALLAALLFVLLLTGALALYMAFALPVLLATAAFFLGRHLWQRSRQAKAAAQAAAIAAVQRSGAAARFRLVAGRTGDAEA